MAGCSSSTPVESSHALQSLTLSIAGRTIEIGSDGRLNASDVQAAIGDEKDRKGTKTAPVRIAARYVEAGTDRRSSGSYSLRYRWESGGLFGGKSVRLAGLRAAKPTISSGLKKKSISIAAFSGLSEPWTEFASINSA